MTQKKVVMCDSYLHGACGSPEESHLGPVWLHATVLEEDELVFIVFFLCPHALRGRSGRQGKT